MWTAVPATSGLGVLVAADRIVVGLQFAISQLRATGRMNRYKAGTIVIVVLTPTRVFILRPTLPRRVVRANCDLRLLADFT